LQPARLLGDQFVALAQHLFLTADRLGLLV
jgi:hypothetical protein